MTHRNVLCSSLFPLVLCLIALSQPCSPAAAQSTPPPPSTTPSTPAQSDQTEDADAPPPPAHNPRESSTAVNIDTAWSLLTSIEANVKRPEQRIQALAALGTLGASPRGEKVILSAFTDPDLDVRTGAVLAAGETKDHKLIPELRKMLDDKQPQVVFTAAITLWKMNDHSGAKILMAVVDGQRKAGSGLVNGTMHDMSKELHDPTALAKIGALQGASMLLGPFGFGITAYEYVRKNGGDSARVLAIEQLSRWRTREVRDSFVDALNDKDPTVRAAAAKALGAWHDKEVAEALAGLFADPKLPVRLTGCAAYLRANGVAPGAPPDRTDYTGKP